LTDRPTSSSSVAAAAAAGRYRLAPLSNASKQSAEERDGLGLIGVRASEPV